MKSDVIQVTNEGIGVREALDQTERVAAFKKLPKKDALHLRLLTEEMVGMMQGLTGEREAKFWIEDEKGTFQLHLKAETRMNAEMRKNLLAASSSGRNEAAKGVMGKIRELFERLMEPVDGLMPNTLSFGMYYTGGVGGDELSLSALEQWSLNQYRATVQEREETKEAWDELEKSVVANLADEVKIAIADETVEMIIYKKF